VIFGSRFALNKRHLVVVGLLLCCVGLFLYLQSAGSSTVSQSPRSAATTSPRAIGSTLSLAGNDQQRSAATRPPSKSPSAGSTTIAAATGQPTLSSPGSSGAFSATGAAGSTGGSGSGSGPGGSGSSSAVPRPSTVSPTTASAPAPAGGFVPGFVYPAAPSGLGFMATNSTLVIKAQTCARSGTSCEGLTSGASSSCTYPAYSGAGVTAAGYAMWASAPGACRYAIGVVIGHSG
jgi:hypothetical protein